MTAPLSSGRPGRSQFSHGKGRYPHFGSDFQSQRNLPWEVGEDETDLVRGYHASLRSDPTNPYEDVSQDGDMNFVRGNPDLYGPDEPIIQEPRVIAAARYPQPKFRTGVTRQ